MAKRFNEARRQAMPWLTVLHTEAETAEFFAGYWPDYRIGLAYRAGELLGFIVFDDDWIDQLYIAPTAQGMGIGSALLARALADNRPRQLFCFQQNATARQFYEKHGFIAEAFSDGLDNEEKSPDVRYRFPGRH
jgi:GNAT superfamily N-acetyltransferase